MWVFHPTKQAPRKEDWNYWHVSFSSWIPWKFREFDPAPWKSRIKAWIWHLSGNSLKSFSNPGISTPILTICYVKIGKNSFKNWLFSSTHGRRHLTISKACREIISIHTYIGYIGCFRRRAYPDCCSKSSSRFESTSSSFLQASTSINANIFGYALESIGLVRL